MIYIISFIRSNFKYEDCFYRASKRIKPKNINYLNISKDKFISFLKIKHRKDIYKIKL